MEKELEAVLWYTTHGPIKCGVEKRHIKLDGRQWCQKCKRHRDYGCFTKNRSVVTGRQDTCRECNNAYQAIVRARRKGK